MKKINRLKKNHDIAEIVQKRQKFSRDNFIVYYQKTEAEISKIAFSVSKKYGNSVERNKAKRIARSICQKIIKEVKNYNFVIVIKLNSKNKEYIELEQELLFIFKMIIKRQVKGDNNDKNKKI